MPLDNDFTLPLEYEYRDDEGVFIIYYMGRIASFVIEVIDDYDSQYEEKMENMITECVDKGVRKIECELEMLN